MKLYLGDKTLPLINRSRSNPRELVRTRESTEGASFEAYFELYWSRIYRLLVRMLGDPAEAEDVALEAFLRLHRNGPPLDWDSNVGGWLYRVATNLGLHSIRALRRRTHYEESAGRIPMGTGTAASPPDLVSDRESQQLARQVLARMNPRQSQLLILRYSGMTYKDIAASLDLSPASIGPLLLRAEREFEKRYRALSQEDS